MLDIAYNHSSKTRYKVVSKGLDKVADKYDLDRPDSWSKKIDFLNDCNQKQLSEAGLEILKARKESVRKNFKWLKNYLKYKFRDTCL